MHYILYIPAHAASGRFYADVKYFACKTNLLDWIKTHRSLLSERLMRNIEVYRNPLGLSFFDNYEPSEILNIPQWYLCTLFNYIKIHEL